MKYIVSYGAGMDSTAMIIWLLQHKKPIDYVVFADTGNEMPETYKTLQDMSAYLGNTRIPLITVYPAKNRTLQQRCEDRQVIPDRIRRWCTRDVKITPIFKFYRTLKDEITQYIGIDASEKRRCKKDPKEWIHNNYPLVENDIDRKKCIDIIQNAGFPLPIKSGCYFCVYNNIERVFWIWQNHPDLFGKAMEFEEQNKHFPRQTLFPKIPLRKLEEHFKDDTWKSLVAN